MMAERARSFQYDVSFRRMSGYERLIVHTNAPKLAERGENRIARGRTKIAESS